MFKVFIEVVCVGHGGCIDADDGIEFFSHDEVKVSVMRRPFNPFMSEALMA